MSFCLDGNSTYGQRVLNEVLPDNINAGDYSSGWAESIDTDKINFEPYGKNSIAQDIDGAADNGYNGNNNSVDNGGISDVNVSNQGANSGSFGQSQETQSGEIEKSCRAWQEDEGNFLQRVQGGSNEGGQGKRILRLGDSLFAYSEAEYDGSSAANAVNILKSAGIDAIYCDGVTETHKNGVTFENTQAVTASDGKVYVSSIATLPDIRIAAHEAVHVNDVQETEAYANYESVVCDNILWGTDEYLDIAEIINENHYAGQFDITDTEFGKLFRRELTAYLNEFLVADPEFAEQKFSKMFDNWDAVVEVSRKFNEDIGIDYTISQSNSNNGVSEADSEGSAFSMDENSELQSTAKGNELDIETMSFEEDGVEDTAEELSYEEKVMLESSGIDTSITQKKKRINKIAERLGVKIAWDIDGDPSEVGNGYYENGVIHMNKRAKALATVFAHEYIHHIEQSKLWSSFKKFIEGTKAYKDWITVRGGNSDVEQAEKNYKLRLETAYSKAGKEVADSDVIANFMAERFFGGSFEGDIKSEENAALLLSEISKSDKWYHNIIRWARQMISKFKGDKLGEEFYKIEGLLLKARKDVQKNPTTNTGGRKYSFNENLSQQLQDWLNGGGQKYGSYNGNYFELGSTPEILKKHGAPSANIIMYSDVIVKVTGGKHSISFDEIARLPSQLNEPILLFKGSVPNSFVALTELLDKNCNDVIVAVHINKQHGRTVVNKIASLYSKSNNFGDNRIIEYVNNQISQNNLIDASNKKAPNWFTSRGLQLPKEVQTILSANNSIPNSAENVNEKSGNRKNSVTPASEAETIARLAKEGRSAEYVKQRVDASMDAERVAKRWLKANKSSYDSEKLAAKITRMVLIKKEGFKSPLF